MTTTNGALGMDERRELVFVVCCAAVSWVSSPAGPAFGVRVAGARATAGPRLWPWAGSPAGSR